MAPANPPVLADAPSPLPSGSPRVQLWIKVCGMTDAAAVAAALAAGVEAIGFVFAPSVRRLQPSQAAVLAAPARGRCALAAVMLHPSQQWVDEILRVVVPDLLQTELADLPALRLPASLQLLPVVRSADCEPPPARLLFEGRVSGSGQVANWNDAGRLARGTQLVLAGGLHAGNVASAVAAVRPFGVDVSSGVEATPGRKSPELIAKFVQAARAAARELT